MASNFFGGAAKLAGDGAAEVVVLGKKVWRMHDELPNWAKVGIAVALVGVEVYYFPYHAFCSPAAAVGKMMKAPGGGGKLISRAVFQANPQAYFRGLRAAGAALV